MASQMTRFGVCSGLPHDISARTAATNTSQWKLVRRRGVKQVEQDRSERLVLASPKTPLADQLEKGEEQPDHLRSRSTCEDVCEFLCSARTLQ